MMPFHLMNCWWSPLTASVLKKGKEVQLVTTHRTNIENITAEYNWDVTPLGSAIQIFHILTEDICKDPYIE